MVTQSFQLAMRAGPKPGQTYELAKNEITIGRDISNDIVVSDAEVSRKHVRLIVQAGQYILEDLGSTNGTFVNEQRISGPRILSEGDTIQLGEHVVFVFEAVGFDPDATVAVSAKDVKVEEPAPEPAAIPAAPPQPQYQPPPADTFQEMPPSPVGGTPIEEAPKDNRRTFILVGCGCLLLLLVCVGIPFIASFFIDFQSLFNF